MDAGSATVLLGTLPGTTVLATPKKHRSRGTYAQHCNKMCQEAAQYGKIEVAESWMNKILSGGFEPQLDTLKELLKAWIKNGMLDKSEEWLTAVSSPALHPEFFRMELDSACYNLMLKAFADAGDVVRAERYAGDMRAMGWKVNAESYTSLVRGNLQNSDPRRAHCWCTEMIEVAGFKKPNKAVMAWLIRSLADIGNTSSANKWLGYMFDLRLKLDQETYDYVRAAHPAIVNPSQLSGENWRPVAPEAVPVTLNGEHHTARMAEFCEKQKWGSPRRTPRPHLSPISSRSRMLYMPIDAPERQIRTAPARQQGQLPPMSARLQITR